MSRKIGDGLRGRVFVREGVVAVTGEGVRAYTRAGAGAELAQGQSWQRGRARLELTQGQGKGQGRGTWARAQG